MRLLKTSLSLAIVAVLSGCGGGGGGNAATDNSGSPSQTQVGRFTDSAVGGVSYKTATQSGLTNAKGEFNFIAGEMVTFSIGNIELGSAKASEDVTPMDLPAPILISQLLQSLDADGDPDTAGITISSEARTIAETLPEGKGLDWNSATFEAELSDLILQVDAAIPGSDSKVPLKIKSRQQVIEHLNRNPVIAQSGKDISEVALKKIAQLTHSQKPDSQKLYRLLDIAQFTNIQKGYSYLKAISLDKNGELDKVTTQSNVKTLSNLVTWSQTPALLDEKTNQDKFVAQIASLLKLNPAILEGADYRELFRTKGKRLDVDATLTAFSAHVDLLKHNRAEISLTRAQVREKLQLLMPNSDLKFDIDYNTVLVFKDNLLYVPTVESKLNRISLFIDKLVDPKSTPRVMAYSLKYLGFSDINIDQDYNFKPYVSATSIDFDKVQSVVSATEKLAAYARSYVIWPDQSRFNNTVNTTEASATELKKWLLEAGFSLPKEQASTDNLQHFKNALVLRTLNNTLDLATVQRAISAQPTPGVASIKVHHNKQLNHNFYPVAIRHDGAIVIWKAKYVGRPSADYINEQGKVKVFNLDGPAAVRVYSTQFNNAAIRTDGSVLYWSNRDLDADPIVLPEFDAKNPAVDIAATLKTMAVLRSDGSVVTIGDGDAKDISAISSELDGKNPVVSLHSTGNTFTALRQDGSVVFWGKKSEADQDKLKLEAPGQDPFNPEGTKHLAIQKIYSNKGAYAGIKGDGSVVTWGDASKGADVSRVKADIDGTVSIISIATTSTAFAALRQDGKVVSWGDVKAGGASQPNEKDYPDWLYKDKKNKIYADWLFDGYGDGKGNIDWPRVLSELIYVGSSMPENHTELESGVASIHASDSGFFAYKENGKSQAWGYEMWLPQDVKDAIASQKIEQVYTGTGSRIFVAKLTDGSLLQWGQQFGETNGAAAPSEQLNGSVSVKDVYINTSSVYALLENGAVVPWGYGSFDIVRNWGFNNNPMRRFKQDPTLFDGSREDKKITAMSVNGMTYTALHADSSITTWGMANGGGNSQYARNELGPRNVKGELNPTRDMDKDGLDFSTERKLGTSDYSWDSDGDGVLDIIEVNQTNTSPTQIRPVQGDIDNKGLPKRDDGLVTLPGTTQPASWIRSVSK
ncbi:hypothetical protein QWZ04_08985 [Vibrio tapetis subsp. quintayensis]|uniref:hypothetical protein n=1 Tax=Vibrio tapetis TaxID=52443 RepID=UPI0025B2FD33|nr:hypothetical protein [Vibrio tapetis]MDN3680460.1 hypothetical protein [Vibrio tapetis subsp. quintayensis]